MRTTRLLSLSCLLAASMMVPATTLAASTQQKQKTSATAVSAKKSKKQTPAKGKLLAMDAFVDQLMAKMTLQEKIGQLKLLVAGDITTGGALNT